MQADRGVFATICGFAFCFAAGMIACLYQAFHQSDATTTLLFDSGHYLESCRMICLYWHQVWSGHHLLAASPKLVEYLMLDGPVFPGLLALACAVLDKIPTQGDWRLFIEMQSCLQALAAGLVFLISKRFTGSTKWSVAAGLTWALYPAAVVGSQRILTETLSTVLLLLIVLLLSKEFVANGSGIMRAIAAGICNVLLLLTKPPLVFAWLFVNCLALFQIDKTGKRAAFTFCLAVAGAMTMLPWLAFTYKSTGHVQVIPQRVPTYNMLNGCNLEADGWGAYPANTMISIFPESEGPIPLALGIWRDNPRDSINLALRKIPRLWSLPWNDFRARVFGLTITMQEYWHRFLILLGLGGLFAFLYGIRPAGVKERESGFITAACVSVVAGHFVYIPFESLSRYGFTAMPFIVILAAYLMCVVSQSHLFARCLAKLLPTTVLLLVWSSCDMMPFCVQLIPEPRLALWFYYGICWLLIALTAFSLWLCLKEIAKAHSAGAQFAARPFYFYAGCIAVGLLISSILIAHALCTVEVAEWSVKLRNGQTACRQMDLATVRKDAHNLAWALVLLDGDAGLNDATVKVNGKVIADKVSSVYNYYPARYQLLNVMQFTAAAFGRSQEDMRQWRAVPVPLSWLNLDGKNEIEVSPAPGSHATVYGEYQMASNNRRCILSLDYLSHARMWRCTDNLESRILDPVGLTKIASSSWLVSNGVVNNHDLSPAPGLQTGTYRMYLVLGSNHSWLREKLKKEAAQRHDAQFAVTMKPANFQLPVNSEANANVITLCPASLKNMPMAQTTVLLPEAVTADSHLQITLSGRTKSNSNSALLGIVAVLQGPNPGNTDVVLPSTPKAVAATNSWQGFSFSDVVPTVAVLGRAQAIRLQFYPQGEVNVKDLTLTVRTAHKPVFNGLDGPVSSVIIL